VNGVGTSERLGGQLHRRSKRTIVAMVSAVVVVSLQACSGSSKGASGKGTPTTRETAAANAPTSVTIGYGFDNQGGFNFDPMLSVQTIAAYIQHLVLGGLFSYAPDGTLLPGLASGFNVVSPMVADVTLRPNLTFQDGTPLTAYVVKEDIERTATNKGSIGVTVIRPTSRGGQLRSIDVLSPTQLRFTMSTPVSSELVYLLASSEGVVVDPKQFSSPSLATAPNGAGPYKVVSYTPNQQMVLTASSSYWDAKETTIKNVNIDAVSIQSPTTGINEVTTGQLDYYNAYQADTASVLAAAKGNIVADVTPSSTQYVWFNICKQPYKTVTAAQVAGLGDLKVRTAMNLMVDRDALNQAVYDGKSEPRTQNWLKSESFYDPSLASAFSYDPAKAKTLMAQSGFPHGFSFTVVVNVTPTVTRMAQYLQQQWAQLAIKMNILDSTNIGADWFLGLKGPAVMTNFIGVGLFKLASTYDASSRNNACGWTQQQPYVNTLVATSPNDQAMLKTTWQASAQNVAATQSEIMLDWGVNQQLYNKSKLAHVVYTTDGLGTPLLDPTRTT